jgi:serine protease
VKKEELKMNRKKVLCCGLFSLLVVLLFGYGAAGQQPFNGLPANVEIVPDEIIVKFKPGVGEEAIERVNRIHGTGFLYRSPFADFMRLQIPAGKKVEEMVEAFQKEPNVEYAVPNSIAHAHFSPNDPLYSYQWHLDNPVHGGIHMEAAWDIEGGGNSGVIVAVVDTGVAYEESGRKYSMAPDLAYTKFVAGWDFVNNDAHPNDDNSHGTHVTGTIAQSTNNGIGVAGVAFNCSIMPVKVLNKNGSGTLQQVVDGIHYAVAHGADVINMSLGWPAGYDPGQPLKDALNDAYYAGVTVVCSSGNDGANTVSYPAAYATTIAVGATRYDETRASYSNYGDALDLTAPGGDLDVDQNGDGYGDGVLQNTFNPITRNTRDFGYWFFDGTSMAAPHVSGVAALVISHGIATTPDEVRDCLQSTAEDKGVAGWDEEYGWGIVDAYAALNYVPFNYPPVAVDDSYSVLMNNTLVVEAPGVLGNDSDANGDTLTSVLQSGPTNGELTLNANGSFTYTPDQDFVGTDTFEYTANDGTTNSDPATVTITVTEPALNVLHVGVISMELSRRSAGRKNTFTKALATVTIVDADSTPVEGATVYGHWSGATQDADSGVTDASGQTTLASDEVKNARRGTTFMFTVDNVTKDGWTYDPSANSETSNSINVP